jgi:hypothetical protein
VKPRLIATLLLCFAATPALLQVVAQPVLADASMDQNVTAMKASIIGTLATWVPFVLLFILLGCALSAVGLHLWGTKDC